MKLSNELTYARLRHPELFDLDAAQGIRATSSLLTELELLVAGVKKLRKSYTMKHLHNPDAVMTASQHAAFGTQAGMQRFSKTLAGVPDKATFGELPEAPAPIMHHAEPRELEPNPELDASIDAVLND